MLSLAPWLRAPLLLLRRPGVAVALVAAAFVAALPAAAAPLFLSSARNAALTNQIADACPWIAGAHVSAEQGFAADLPAGVTPPAGPAELTAYRRQKLAALAPAGLTAPVHSTWMTANGSTAGGPAGPVNVMTRDDFRSHVRLVEGGTTAGLWLPDRYAAAAKVRVGDRLTISGRDVRDFNGIVQRAVVTTVPVAAVYTDLRDTPADPYWCAHRRLYEGEPGQEFSNRPIAPLILVDGPTWAAGLAATNVERRQDADFALADPRLDVATAATLSAGLQRMRTQLRADPLTSLNLQVTMRLPDYTGRTGVVRRSLVPPVLSITAAGVAVGLLVVAAAALFWVQRRRRELTVLAAHGVGARGLGLKALLEALPALALGAAAGWYAAVLLVRTAGPSPVLTADAVPRSRLAAAAALLAAALVVTVAAAARSRSLTDVVSPHRRVRLLRFPWELLLVAAGVAAWFGLSGSREAASDSFGAVAQVPGRLLIVPILVIVGGAALAARVGARWLRAGTRRPGSARPAVFLAGRRLRREAAIAAVLAGATAVPIALAAYGATVNGSVRATLSAEASFMIGADVVVTLAGPAPVPAALAGRATPVLRANGVIVGGVQTDVLVIDPDTFARDAFWNDATIGLPLETAMSTVRSGGAVGGWPLKSGPQPMTYLGRETPPLDVRAVAGLPAGQGSYPTLLVTRETAGELADRATPQLWVRGDPDLIRRAVVDSGLPLARISVARDLYADTVFEAVTYTFDYLAALSLLTGLITTVGLLLYLESRAPAHRRGFALMRRMRLRPGRHRLALALELSAPLVAGLVGGVLLAGGVVGALAAEFEINPGLPPGTVVAVPYVALAGTAAAVAVIATLAIGYAQRRVGRATPTEVLREVV